MKEEFARIPGRAKSASYEAVVAEVNAALAEFGDDSSAAPKSPVLFIVGPPRSGSTLLHQILACTGGFGVVTNFIARFFANPAFGARVQTLAGPWLGAAHTGFRSNAGTTSNWAEPHEFGYFWEHHFPFSEHHEPSLDELADVDVVRLATHLGQLERSLGRPLLLKNLLLSFVLPFLAEHFPTAVFVQLHRPLLPVAQSILRVRKETYGSDIAWWSVRPRDAEAFLEESAPEQIAYQIERVLEAIRRARQTMSTTRWLDVDYQAMCAAPAQTAARLAEYVGIDPDTLSRKDLPASFPGSTGDPGDPSGLGAALRARGLTP
ncbi:MAG: sulfotransferase [bacterium]|nr:sulfotransferase [bacterium]